MFLRPHKIEAHRNERKSDLCTPRNELRDLVPNYYIHVSVSYIPRIGSAFLAAAKQADRSLEYINRSQIYDRGNWVTVHYNSVLKITLAVSFLGIHKSERDIYIGFSPALHLQCRVQFQKPLHSNLYS